MNDKITGVRIPAELREKINELAQADGRKLSQQIIRMLRAEIDRQQRPVKV